MGGLIQVIITLAWSVLPGCITAIFSTTSNLFIYCLTPVYQGILYTLYGWYAIAAYILLILASIVLSILRVIAYIFYPIVWVVGTVVSHFPTDLYALFQWSVIFKIILSLLAFMVFLGVYAILFIVVLPGILCTGQIVWRRSRIPVRVKRMLRVLCRRLLIRLGILVPVRHVRNRARGADNTGNQQPRNEVRDVRNRARGADNTGNQ